MRRGMHCPRATSTPLRECGAKEALEGEERQLKASFAVVARDFLPSIWHWGGGLEFLLFYWDLLSCPANDGPRTAAGRGRVRLIARWTTTQWQLSALLVHASTC